MTVEYKPQEDFYDLLRINHNAESPVINVVIKARMIMNPRDKDKLERAKEVLLDEKLRQQYDYYRLQYWKTSVESDGLAGKIDSLEKELRQSKQYVETSTVLLNNMRSERDRLKGEYAALDVASEEKGREIERLKGQWANVHDALERERRNYGTLAVRWGEYRNSSLKWKVGLGIVAVVLGLSLGIKSCVDYESEKKLKWNATQLTKKSDDIQKQFSSMIYKDSVVQKQKTELEEQKKKLEEKNKSLENEKAKLTRDKNNLQNRLNFYEDNKPKPKFGPPKPPKYPMNTKK